MSTYYCHLINTNLYLSLSVSSAVWLTINLCSADNEYAKFYWRGVCLSFYYQQGDHGSGGNAKVGGSIPSSFSLHVEVSLGKMLNPKLLPK